MTLVPSLSHPFSVLLCAREVQCVASEVVAALGSPSDGALALHSLSAKAAVTLVLISRQFLWAAAARRWSTFCSCVGTVLHSGARVASAVQSFAGMVQLCK